MSRTFAGAGRSLLLRSATFSEVVLMRPFISWVRGAILGALCTALASSGLMAAEEKAAEAAIRKALDQKTVMEFVDCTLSDVLAYLQDHHQINIKLDRKALDDAGFGSDTPVTCNLREISLRSALRLFLNEYNLTWVIENEVLLVTTVEAAGEKVVTRVYDVFDLVHDPKGDDLKAYNSLIELVTTTVAPTSWDEVGGPGSIAPFQGMLAIRQTQNTQDEIVALFAELRRVRLARGAKGEARAGVVRLDK
jgi:hypothetical protein